MSALTKKFLVKILLPGSLANNKSYVQLNNGTEILITNQLYANGKKQTWLVLETGMMLGL